MTSPRLVVGLGGTLAGDDAVGLHLAQSLAADPRRPADVEAVAGDADLLRLAPLLAGRAHVVLVDAVLARPGEVAPLVGVHPLAGIETRQPHAHQLSAVQALELLLLSEPALAGTHFTWFLVPVAAAAAGDAFSPALARRLPELLTALLSCLR